MSLHLQQSVEARALPEPVLAAPKSATEKVLVMLFAVVAVPGALLIARFGLIPALLVE